MTPEYTFDGYDSILYGEAVVYDGLDKRGGELLCRALNAQAAQTEMITRLSFENEALYRKPTELPTPDKVTDEQIDDLLLAVNADGLYDEFHPNLSTRESRRATVREWLAML